MRQSLGPERRELRLQLSGCKGIESLIFFILRQRVRLPSDGCPCTGGDPPFLLLPVLRPSSCGTMLGTGPGSWSVCPELELELVAWPHLCRCAALASFHSLCRSVSATFAWPRWSSGRLSISSRILSRRAHSRSIMGGLKASSDVTGACQYRCVNSGLVINARSPSSMLSSASWFRAAPKVRRRRIPQSSR